MLIALGENSVRIENKTTCLSRFCYSKSKSLVEIQLILQQRLDDREGFTPVWKVFEVAEGEGEGRGGGGGRREKRGLEGGVLTCVQFPGPGPRKWPARPPRPAFATQKPLGARQGV